MPFEFKRLDAIPDVVLVEPRRFGDDRGWFMETYKRSDFVEHGIPHDFPQDNHSRSAEVHTLRGLHYQLPPHAQGKLVRCPRGRLFDVAADLRQGSPSYGRWVAAELSAANGRMLWVPPGFAHGVLTLEPDSEIMYKVTAEYAPDHERAIRWDDPDLGIDWPATDPVLNERDASAPTLKEAEHGFVHEEGGAQAGPGPGTGPGTGSGTGSGPGSGTGERR